MYSRETTGNWTFNSRLRLKKHCEIDVFLAVDLPNQYLFQLTLPEWNAKYFMVDKCDEEINAIESVFPGNSLLAILS